jgi:hypothetical protein
MNPEAPKSGLIKQEAHKVAEQEGTAKMTFGEVITELSKRGFTLSLEGNALRYTNNRIITADERECIAAHESDFVDLLKIASWSQIRRWALFTSALQKDPQTFIQEWISEKREPGVCAICHSTTEAELSYCTACSLAGAEIINGLLKHMGTILKQVTDNPKATLKDYTPHLKAFERD